MTIANKYRTKIATRIVMRVPRKTDKLGIYIHVRVVFSRIHQFVCGDNKVSTIQYEVDKIVIIRRFVLELCALSLCSGFP